MGGLKLQSSINMSSIAFTWHMYLTRREQQGAQPLCVLVKAWCEWPENSLFRCWAEQSIVPSYFFIKSPRMEMVNVTTHVIILTISFASVAPTSHEGALPIYFVYLRTSLWKASFRISHSMDRLKTFHRHLSPESASQVRSISNSCFYTPCTSISQSHLYRESTLAASTKDQRTSV